MVGLLAYEIVPSAVHKTKQNNTEKTHARRGSETGDRPRRAAIVVDRIVLT
jgi:hypothetical protein